MSDLTKNLTAEELAVMRAATVEAHAEVEAENAEFVAQVMVTARAEAEAKWGGKAEEGSA